MATAQQQFEVDLPAGGGKLALRSQDEADLWEELHDKYIKDYGLTKANDLALLGAILSQHLALFRSQQRLNGMTPETDQAGVPTGRYILDPKHTSKDSSMAQSAITKASEEIRALEKALGIDKKTREAGGQYNTADFIGNLKRAANRMGVHIAKRVKMYEEFNNDLRWRLRVLDNADDEDRAHHGISETSILDFCRIELGKIEAEDKKYAKQHSSLFIGKL